MQTRFLFILALALPTSAQTLPSVPGYRVEVYADVDDPVRMGFDSGGVLYVGRDASGSGGGFGDAVKIHRVEVGGSPVSEFGDAPVIDPDALIVDRTGSVGSVGAILLGGLDGVPNMGQLTEVDTTGAVTTLIGPTSTFHNPDDFAFDATGRLLFTNVTGPSAVGIYEVVNGVASLLVGSTSVVKSLEVDVGGRILGADTNGSIHVYAADGSLLQASLVTGMDAVGALAYGVIAQEDPRLYAIDSSKNLVQIAPSGGLTAFGSGFDHATNLEIGPDGALYVAEFGNDRILRVSEDLAIYCTAGVSASGCSALLNAAGSPSATAPSGFNLAATGVEGAKDSLFFFGTNGRQANPWGNGTSYQCVVPPVKRTGILVGSGQAGQCDGAPSVDLNALWCPASCPKPNKNPGAGTTVQAQLWYRDPLNTSNQTTSFSDAIEFVVAP